MMATKELQSISPSPSTSSPSGPTRSVIRETILGSAGTLLGVAIALAILAVIAGLSILASGSSAGLISAISEINAFLVLIGLGVAVGLVIKALTIIGS